MKVQKPVDASEPGYPSRRQFSQYGRLLAGVATIGLGAAVGCGGDERRLRGSVPVEPRPSATALPPVPSPGLIRAEPRSSCASTNLPPAATNLPPAAVTRTNTPVIKGMMRVEPKEPR